LRDQENSSLERDLQSFAKFDAPRSGTRAAAPVPAAQFGPSMFNGQQEFRLRRANSQSCVEVENKRG
jgi:hypothetical protein